MKDARATAGLADSRTGSWIRRAGVVAAVVAVALLAWGLVEPYFYDVERETVELPELPASWEGRRIAQIADWQVGMWLANTLTMRRVVELLVEERPEAVLFTGDFVAYVEADSEDAAEALDTVVELLAPLLEADIPVYGVLGNHDYGMRWESSTPDLALAEQVRARLEAAGVEMLQNEAVVLETPERADELGAPETLYLVGIGAHWPDRDDIDAAFDRLAPAAPRLVMMHHPDSFEAIPAASAPLAVAAHTHGGQIRIPFTPDWSWLTFAKTDEVHVDGWSDSGYGAPGNRLYVNRGVGFSALPLRINAVPEVTLFTLRRSDARP